MLSKDDILKELRRTAKENGAIPLGERRFRDETGITPTDWEKYWPRFGDAQTEAGFNKNTFGSESYPQEFIFEKFILLSRELGKLPVSGDWKVKRYNDPNFPSINSLDRLSRHLGSRQKFIETLMRYAEEKGYRDIVKLCHARLQETNSTEHEADVPLKESSFGFVYLGKQGTSYKVGKTYNTDRRREDISLLMPEPFELLHAIKTDDPNGIEAYWHTRFKSKWIRGEWFKLNSSDVKAFKRWKKIA